MTFEFADVPSPFDTTGSDTVEAPVRYGRSRFGKLDDLAFWLAARRGHSSPRPPNRARVIVFAADHGVAARGVSTRGPHETRSLVEMLRAGQTPLAVLADEAGAGLRVVDIAVSTTGDDGNDPLAGGTGDGTHSSGARDGNTRGEEESTTGGSEVGARFHVRDGSGSIDREDALTEDEAEAALLAGVRLADAEVDAGADLLIPAELGVGASTPAATVVAALTGTEPVAAVGRGSGIDDHTWMRKTVAVRDALRRARPVVTESRELARTAGGADLVAMAGFLAQAAVRRTPVLLDGLSVSAAALLAEELAPGARAWWVAAHRSDEPAHALALDHLDLDPVLDLGISEGGGCGAVVLLPLLSMAARAAAPSPGSAR